jgi:hypothetical protein
MESLAWQAPTRFWRPFSLATAPKKAERLTADEAAVMAAILSVCLVLQNPEAERRG